MKHNRIGFALLALLLGTPWGYACQVPVFRFALERWMPDPYRAVILHRGPLSGEHQAAVDRLREAEETANVGAIEFDLDEKTEEESALLPPYDKESPLPLILLLYPLTYAHPEPTLCWSGPLTVENVEKLVDSPVRRHIRERVLEGDSSVWLLVEGEDAEANDETARILSDGLAAATNTFEIPEGVVSREDFMSGGPDGQGYGPMDMENVLGFDIPLRIGFSTKRLARNDPAEEHLLAMLLGSLPGLSETNVPLVFPVFGRGRALEPIPPELMSEETMLYACSYICGACSCMVKAQNPGFDLLLSGEWDPYLQDDSWITERELPPLVGAGDVMEEGPTDPTGIVAAASEEAVAEETAAPGPEPEPERGGLSPLLVGIGGAVIGLLAVLAILTIAFRKNVS